MVIALPLSAYLLLLPGFIQVLFQKISVIYLSSLATISSLFDDAEGPDTFVEISLPLLLFLDPFSTLQHYLHCNFFN